MTATARPTDASVENIWLVADGECDLGFSLGDTASDAVRGTGAFAAPVDVVALARTYDSFTHLVVRADSGISTVSDLRHQRVGLGAQGSGTRVVAQRILSQSGLALPTSRWPPSRWRSRRRPCGPATSPRSSSSAGSRTEQSSPSPRTSRSGSWSSTRLVDAMVSSYGPEYVRGPIPASTYGLPGGVETVSVKNYLVAGPQMPEAWPTR